MREKTEEEAEVEAGVFYDSLFLPTVLYDPPVDELSRKRAQSEVRSAVRNLLCSSTIYHSIKHPNRD